eukprot:5310596-Pleurochrysis_carterae.AAC.1
MTTPSTLPSYMTQQATPEQDVATVRANRERANVFKGQMDLHENHSDQIVRQVMALHDLGVYHLLFARLVPESKICTAMRLLQCADLTTLSKANDTRVIAATYSKLREIDEPNEHGTTILPAGGAIDSYHTARLTNAILQLQALATAELKRVSDSLHGTVQAEQQYATRHFSPLTPGLVTSRTPNLTAKEESNFRYRRSQMYLGLQRAPAHDAHLLPSKKAILLFEDWTDADTVPGLPAYNALVAAGGLVQGGAMGSATKRSPLLQAKTALLALGAAYAHGVPPSLSGSDAINVDTGIDRVVVVSSLPDDSNAVVVALSSVEVERNLEAVRLLFISKFQIAEFGRPISERNLVTTTLLTVLFSTQVDCCLSHLTPDRQSYYMRAFWHALELEICNNP